MPKITEQQLKKSIKEKKFDKLYFLTGSEKYLISHYNGILVEKTAGNEPSDFNFHTFDNADDIDQIAVAVNIIPFMEEKNVVNVKNIELEKLKDNDYNKLLQLVNDIPESSVLIVSLTTAETPARPTAKIKKLLESFEKNGTLVEINKKAPSELSKQLIKWAEKYNCEIKKPTADLIISYCGTDLLSLRNELEKLCAYTLGTISDAEKRPEITKEIVEKIVTKNLEAKVFALSDFVLRCNADSAFKQLRQLFYQKEEPIAILSVLAAAYIDLYRVRVATESGKTIDDITKDFDYKRKEFRLRNAQRDGKTMSTADLRKSIDLISRADIQLKSTAQDRHQGLLEEVLGRLIILAGRGK